MQVRKVRIRLNTGTWFPGHCENHQVSSEAAKFSGNRGKGVLGTQYSSIVRIWQRKEDWEDQYTMGEGSSGELQAEATVEKCLGSQWGVRRQHLKLPRVWVRTDQSTCVALVSPVQSEVERGGWHEPNKADSIDKGEVSESQDFTEITRSPPPPYLTFEAIICLCPLGGPSEVDS
jgi:hypothetical protein